MPERSPRQVGEIVANRRGELNLSQADLARLAKVSKRTVLDMESGATWSRPATRERIESALGWPSGSIALIRAGAPPPTADPHSTQLAELDTDELWALITSGRLDAVRRGEALALYEQHQAALLPERLERLSRRGLMATSRYVAILLEADAAEGFRHDTVRDDGATSA